LIYGTAKWEGGKPGCNHKQMVSSRGDRPLGKLHGGHRTIDEATGIYKKVCGKCGARRVDEQLGLETTPGEYVANLVAVLREARRVLRDDGTLWLNLGDSYAGSWGNQGRKEGRGTQRPINGPMMQSFEGPPLKERNTGATPTGLKPKDLVGIPWRAAFALQADGWWLRSDVIWHNPNPMPESVTDRPTKSHEYVFLLAKSERYYYDADAAKEPGAGRTAATWEQRKARGEGMRLLLAPAA
jgi:DNA modification methylase